MVARAVDEFKPRFSFVKYTKKKNVTKKIKKPWLRVKQTETIETRWNESTKYVFNLVETVPGIANHFSFLWVFLDSGERCFGQVRI